MTSSIVSRLILTLLLPAAAELVARLTRIVLGKAKRNPDGRNSRSDRRGAVANVELLCGGCKSIVAARVE